MPPSAVFLLEAIHAMNRRWLLWLLIIAFIWLIVSRFTEIEKLARTLAQGQWQWVAVASLIQVVFFVSYAALYQAAFATVEVASRVRDLLPVVLASRFVNVITPVGSPAGAALFIDDAARRGQSPSRVAAGVMLVLVADFSAFLPVLAIGMIYLFLQHDLQTYEVIGALLLLLLIGALSSVLLFGLWSPVLLQRLLVWVQRGVGWLFGRFKRPAPLDEDWTAKTAADFAGAAVAIGKHPGRLAHTLGVGLVTHLSNLLTLYVLFHAFRTPITIGPLVAGYAIGLLFWIVSPTPQGIGVVEGVMTLVYTSLGVPSGAAAVIVLSFRGLNFWLPLLLGFLLV